MLIYYKLIIIAKPNRRLLNHHPPLHEIFLDQWAIDIFRKNGIEKTCPLNLKNWRYILKLKTTLFTCK